MNSLKLHLQSRIMQNKKNYLISIIFLLFSQIIWAEDSEDSFNVNLPAKISETNAEFVYKLLVAEISAQNNDLPTAGHLYLDLAKLTKEEVFAQFSTQIAALTKNGRLALDSADVWTQINPNSIEAQKILAEVLISSGNLAKARPVVKKILDIDKSKGDSFLYLNNIVKNIENKTNALRFSIDIAKPYSSLIEAHFLVAHAALLANQKDILAEEIKKMKTLNPNWETLAFFEGNVAKLDSLEAAIAVYINFLKNNSKSNDIRLELAKTYLQNKDLKNAKKHFEILSKSPVATADNHFTLALLALEAEDLSLADKYFHKSLEKGYANPFQIYMYMAQIQDQKSLPEIAISWLEKIDHGPGFMDAKIYQAQIINKYYGLDRAFSFMEKFQNMDREEKLKFLQLKTSFLFTNKEYLKAIKLMNKEEINFKDSAEFYFDLALLNEKLKNFDTMERSLKKAISMKPNYAIAYNALGYSYAERNINLEDAKKYVEIALSIEPNNHYILDSMAWVHYRLKNFDIAYEFVHKAFKIQQDPEIAAHFSEILWAQGKMQEANKILKESLARYPDNEILIETAQRVTQ